MVRTARQIHHSILPETANTSPQTSLGPGVWSRHTRVSDPGHSGSTPRVLAIIVSALLVLGWAMTLNARSIYDSDFFLFISRRNILPSAQGSVDAAISAAWMLRAT